MLLAIDTATRWVGLALHDGASIIAESGWQCINTHTIELTPAIDEMLNRSNLVPADLQGIAVAIGPGSYTGLRVALAMAKGLALANTVPLVGVPTLDIVAASIGPVTDRLIVSAAAGRSRVSVASYKWIKDRWQAKNPPINGEWESILGELDEQPTLFAGEIDPAAAKLIRLACKKYRLALPALSVRRAGFLAELGWRRLRERRLDDVSKLAPLYLRSPDGS